MGNALKKLGETELEIIQAIWNSGNPANSNYILKQLQGTAIISDNEYKSKAGRHFLEKLYNNSIQNMVATLYSNKAIKDSDIEELMNFLDKLEDGQE